jgi:hypothetical protein
MIIWLLIGNQTVIAQFVQYANYRLRFIGDGNDQILKLPTTVNERGLIGNITILLPPLLLPFTDSITVYSRIELLKPTPFIQSTHTCCRPLSSESNICG